MASGISASGVNSMVLGREVAKAREIEQLNGYLTKNEFSQKLARARTGVEALSESELKNSLVRRSMQRTPSSWPAGSKLR